jgi:hypothetical protein
MEPALQIQAQMNFFAWRHCQYDARNNHSYNNANLQQKIPTHARSFTSRRLLRLYPIHVIPVHPHPEAIAHIDAQAFLFDFIDDGFNATPRDNTIAFFQIREHLLHFPALLLLWSKDQEVKDHNQGQEQKNGVEQLTHTSRSL